MDTYSSITNPVDKDMVKDILMTEKHFTETYNSFLNESSTKNLQQDLLSILNDEHEMKFKVSEEMGKRGWHNEEYVNQSDIDIVKQSYNKES